MAHRGNGREFRGKPKEQLLSRISIDAETKCWNWLGTFFTNGYGQFDNSSLSQHRMNAHRASWEIFKGPIPKKTMVLHGCDNRKCVNPDHLRLGTNKENMIDRSRRGFVHQRVLSENDVRTMRRLRQEEGLSYRRLASMFNVTPTTATHAVVGKNWAWLENAPVPTVVFGPGRR